MEMNPEGWEAKKAAALAAIGNDVDQWRIIEVQISEEALNAAFAVPVINAEVVVAAGAR